MKKKGIKIAALFIAASMAATAFSGCNKSEKDDPKKEGTSVGSTAEDKYAPKEGKTYEISVLTMTPAPVGENSYITKMFNEKFNVKLKPVFIDSTKWDEILNVKLASGEVPDIIPSKAPDKLMRYVDQELLQEVPMDVLKKYAPDLVNTISKDAPDAWSYCSLDGKNYGIPYISASYVFRDPVVWRTDWLKNVGISKIPDTIQEWEDALVKFRNDDPDKNGKKDTYGASLSILGPVFGAYGVMNDMWWTSFWLEKDGKIVFSGIEPGSKEGLKLLNKWYKQELIDPEFVTGENKGGYWAVSTDFVNGRIGVSALGQPSHWQKAGGGLASGQNETEMKKINPNATYDFGNPPLGTDGKSRGMTKIALCSGISYTFSKSMEADKLGKILQMFNWPASSHENYMLNWIGVEGEHFEITENDGYKVYNYKEPYKSDRAKRYEEVGVGSFFYEYDLDNAKKTSAAYFDTFTKLGFDKYGIENQFTKLVMPSFSKYNTDLDKLFKEAYISIITGAKPIEYFDEFVANWKKNGGDQLLKEANEHYQKITKK